MEQERTLSAVTESASLLSGRKLVGQREGEAAERRSGSNGVGSLRDGSPPCGDERVLARRTFESCFLGSAVVSASGGLV